MSFDLIESNGLENILNQEISDGECKCFTGRISRYVNIFNGVIPECTFELKDGTIFQALFSHLRGVYNNNAEEIEKELLNRGYEYEYIKDWIDILRGDL